MAEEVKLMKGNEAIAHAAIRYGADGYFGYPITPQSEIMETLMEEKPWETTGMVVLQAESEVAAINMVYGGAGCGKAVMTSSSSPGVSLKQEGISYMAGAELPCLIINVMRGGPGLGTIQPSQADYFQTVKGGGHGDYRLITLAPASVQEMADFVKLGFDLAFKYRNPSIILADGVIGQMMEKVVLPSPQPRLTEEEIRQARPWATQGKPAGRTRNVITSLELDPAIMEQNNIRFAMRNSTVPMPIIFWSLSAQWPAYAKRRKKWLRPRVSNSACCAPSPCGRSRRTLFPVTPTKSKGYWFRNSMPDK